MLLFCADLFMICQLSYGILLEGVEVFGLSVGFCDLSLGQFFICCRLLWRFLSCCVTCRFVFARQSDWNLAVKLT